MNRIFKCTGLPILQWGRWRAELWLVPAGAEIPNHFHQNLDAWLTPLFGRMTWRRNGKSLKVGPVGPLRPMCVRAGVIHGASANSRAAFLTIEHWASSVRPTSAAQDLQLV